MDGRVIAAALFTAFFCLSWQLVLSNITVGDLSAYQIASFQNPDAEAGVRLSHFVVHGNSVYVGAVNSVYRLVISDLRLESNVSTADECPAEPGSEDCLNLNKILFVEPHRHALFTCGSENLGRCQGRHLSTLVVTVRSGRSVCPGRDRSTIGIMAPGKDARHSLYVATTFNSDMDLAPPIARRSLAGGGDALLYAHDDDVIRFASAYTSVPFDINYVYGFSLGNFTYFMTNQGRHGTQGGTAAPVLSKLVRICQAGWNLDAYAEIAVTCQSGSSEEVSYELAQAAHLEPSAAASSSSAGRGSSPVLYAVFATKGAGTSGTPGTSAPSQASAVCAFSMADIEEAFVVAARDCIQKGAEFKVPHLQGTDCPGNPMFNKYEELLCNVPGSYYKYANNPNGVRATALLQLEEAQLTSVVVSVEANHTTAFIGTSEGFLLKVHIENATHARLYEKMKLDDSPVLSDVMLDAHQQRMHILTEQKLLTLRVENCKQYTDCGACIGYYGGMDGDPYCGWCTLQNECTRETDCSESGVSTRWLPYNAAQCLGLSEKTPENLPIDAPRQMIALTVQELPELSDGQNYSCRFNSIASAADTDGSTIRCLTPAMDALPAIPETEDRVTMQLSLHSSETSVDFLTTTFTFYDCTRHKSCTACVGSEWSCDWCVYDNRCVHQTTTCTHRAHNDSIVTGIHNPAPRQGSEFCPQLRAQSSEELVPVGVAREVLVKAAHLPDSTQESSEVDYQCSLMVEGTEQTTSGTRLANDVIGCNSHIYSYSADAQELAASLTVTWNGSWLLDDVHGFNVTLYKCAVDRADCSRCLSVLTSRPELECRWCRGHCAFRDDVGCEMDALNASQPCPAPFLSTVYPTAGPTEGNTVIEIAGTNLGRRLRDILSIRIGSQTCALTGLGDAYVVGQSVRCRTAPMTESSAQLITVAVATVGIATADNLTSSGKVMFTYQDPLITDFAPRLGPEAGGTKVTIRGTQLDTGRDIQAVVADNVACDIRRDSISSTAMECLTGNSTVGWSGRVLVTFDGAVRNSSHVFTYQPNPNVTDIQPRKSIRSGGRNVTVMGNRLQQIQSPQIVCSLERNDNSQTFKEQCTTTNDTHMTCRTPDVSPGLAETGSAHGGRSRRQALSSRSVVVGFVMDGVTGLLRWSEGKAPVDFEFQYVPDPVFEPFPGDGGVMRLEGAKLTIRGTYLNTAQTKAEVRVLIGTQDCALEIFDHTILTCTAPATRPEPQHYDGNRTDSTLPAVYVRHSGHYFFIGYVDYANNRLVLYIVIGAVLVLTPLVLIAVYLWRKLKGSQKQISAILIQMDEVEQGMAENLRVAFAELQTNVTDLTHDLRGTGMPFVSHRQYAANMLFIGLDIQPKTSDPPDNISKGMAQFNKLLTKKTFLLAFIQALDGNRKLAVKDKATIASLITVIMMLENKLSYLTDIMETLMSWQVREAVDNNRPKQLFRRTETIVEKLLSNWIALCLYDQLKDHTALPLFLLYSAIKVQTEKGPVDGVTRQAHFSLSEERMLKECVDFQEMTLHVVVDSEDGEEKEVKVLDVDSIPQVKEKILDSMYRNKPYSDRQRGDNVDIEWRRGKTGRLSLKDVARSVTAGGDSREKVKWQRLNTLGVLGVPDNSLMGLVPKQLPYITMNEAISGPASKDIRVDQDVALEEGALLWHLEKPHEEMEETRKQKKKRQQEALQGTATKAHNITFTRLLTMKGIVQEYVDRMFQAILTTGATPRTIKYLFDFFDRQASAQCIDDADILHIWKSNTLPLRFWVSAITHPNYIFDIRPTPSVESSLGVVGQAFYDACSKSDHQLGLESSFDKLLYNREVSKYRTLVGSFYEDIRDMEAVTSGDLKRELDNTCKNFTGLFSKQSTLLQLYQFTKDSKGLLMNAMEEDEVCGRDSLAYELEQIEKLMAEDETLSWMEAAID